MLATGKAGLRPPMRQWRTGPCGSAPASAAEGLALRCARRLQSCVGRGGGMGIQVEQKDMTSDNRSRRKFRRRENILDVNIAKHSCASLIVTENSER